MTSSFQTLLQVHLLFSILIASNPMSVPHHPSPGLLEGSLVSFLQGLLLPLPGYPQCCQSALSISDMEVSIPCSCLKPFNSYPHSSREKLFLKAQFYSVPPDHPSLISQFHPPDTSPSHLPCLLPSHWIPLSSEILTSAPSQMLFRLPEMYNFWPW